MTSFKQLEVLSENPDPQKWRVPLKEDVFAAFIANGSPTEHKIFGEGSLFSPLLFGKFFDPSDAFPLWEFESRTLLFDLQNGGYKRVDWFQTDTCYVLKAELPRYERNSLQVNVENGKVVEISGLWRKQQDSRTKDWRGGQWWENGFVRRIELPENADLKRTEAHVNNDMILEIKIPKNTTNYEEAKDSEALTDRHKTC